MKRETKGALAIVAAFVVLIGVMVGYNAYSTDRERPTALVVDVTARQRTLTERYIKDTVLALDGVQADPEPSAKILSETATALLDGGEVVTPQGSLDQKVRIPAATNGAVREKLDHERTLITTLLATGAALRREGKSSPTFAADLQRLRVQGAELSSVTGDAAGEITKDSQARLSWLVSVEIVLGLLSAGAAIGMALLLRRSALRQSDRFRSLVHNASDLITVLDEHANCRYQSPSSASVLGYQPSELVGSKVIDLVHPSDKKQVIEAFASAYERPGATVGLRFRLRHSDGRWIVLEGTSTNLLGERSVRGFVVNSRDVTEREVAAAELSAARDAAMEATRLKSQFLASMSHEIRTPMNAVIGLSELLLGTDLDHEQREYAAGVNTAGEGLLAIINDILDFSKIEAGKLELESIDFNLGVLLEDVAALLGESAYGKQLELLAHAYPDLPTSVRGDPTRLRQVLVNLTSNAVKFTSAGEVVLRAMPISVDGRTAVIRFEVSDTGIGIAPDDQRRMFEPFSQADASTTRRFGGTGLGLAIVGQLVELMGGHLGLDSEVDRGSTFWFELPFECDEAAADAPVSPAVEFASLRAIVVDDNATNRLILRQQLSSWGLLPDEAESGPEALELARAAAERGAAYDLAILDLNMPGMDGLELARAIKTDPATAHAKLFLLSSSGRVSKDVAVAAELSGTLAKPVRQSELFNCLIEGLQMHDSESPEASAPISEPSTVDRGVVLLVEDNTMNQLVATRMLAKLGYRADVANNGREAINAITIGAYDAVLMDCQMPEMDGYEATRQIRRAEAGTGRHIPIIAMTAAAMQGDREACLEAGMDDYITKPVSVDAVARAIERWTARATEQEAEPDGRRVPATVPALDPDRFAVLRELDTGDGELLRMLVHEYVNDGTQLLAAMREAIAEGDPQTVERTSHTLKGASANLGATRLTEVCGKLEALGRAAALATAPRLLDEATAEFEIIQSELALELSGS